MLLTKLNVTLLWLLIYHKHKGYSVLKNLFDKQEDSQH